MLKKKLIYLEILASLLLYGCSPSVKQTQAAAEKTTIEVETTAEAKEPEIHIYRGSRFICRWNGIRRKIHTR
ncbi:MAG: hypothetical protein ACLU48_06865 [Clostridiaceae bacterium]